MYPKNIIGFISIVLLVVVGVAAVLVNKQSGINFPFLDLGNKPHLTVEDQFVTS
jgi:hypothetical protein